MKPIEFCTLLLIALGMASGDAVAERPQATQTYDLRFEMTVGPDGKSTSLKALEPLPTLIDQRVQSWVGRLQFDPATVDGVPQPATTTLYLELGPIVLADGKSGYGVTSLSTGPRLVRGSPGRLPRESGAGYFIVHYDKNGRAIAVEYDASNSPPAGREFAKWGLNTVKTFKFAPETVAGTAVAGEARVPLIYCSGRDRDCPELGLPVGAGSDLGGDMVAKSVMALKSPIVNDPI